METFQKNNNTQTLNCVANEGNDFSNFFFRENEEGE